MKTLIDIWLFIIVGMILGAFYKVVNPRLRWVTIFSVRTISEHERDVDINTFFFIACCLILALAGACR